MLPRSLRIKGMREVRFPSMAMPLGALSEAMILLMFMK